MDRAASIIRSGGIVAFPTETVYGLGADAFNPVAVAKIFEAKERPLFDPLIVHIADLSQMNRLVVSMNSTAGKLAGRFWPGPLTMVLPKSDTVPGIVTAGLDTVAIRMPNHLIAIDLIKRSGTPIAAPSANPFGYLSPTCAEHVLEQLGDRPDMILDGGECIVGVESTIIKIEGDRALLLRPGGIPRGEIESLIGPVEASEDLPDDPEAPGQLSRHYSPGVPLRIVDSIDRMDLEETGAGYLIFKKPKIQLPMERTEVLSEKGDLVEAASRLFSSLHRLARLDIDIIYAEAVPEKGLGIAIMDRLKKAVKSK
jgi:L-threonylcarbamoyladenylate synthase